MAKTQGVPFISSPFIKAIFNQAVENNILLMNSDGFILTVNKAFCNNFGYAPSDLRGKSMAVLFTKEDQEKGLPQRELRNVLLTGQGSDNNYLVAKDKTAIWVSGESVLAQKDDGKIIVVKMIQNIHAQKESETSLKNLFELNEDILRSIKDAVVVLNGKMKIVKANDAFIKLFSGTGTNTVSMDFESLTKRDSTGNILLQHIEQTITTGEGFQHIPFNVTIGPDTTLNQEVSGNSMQLSDGSRNILLVLHDITSRKQLEMEREDIMGFVAHEVRTPLANLGLCNDLMEMLLKANRAAEIPDILQRSKKNVTRLNKMIAELYTATKTTSANTQLEIAPYHIGDMIKEAVETVRSLHPAYSIDIINNPDISVDGDKYRMIEVVTNYLTNAVKYSNGSTSITVSAVIDNRFVTVAVKDQGPGIPANQLPFIFEKFYRAEKTRSLEGLGLGLYLCRRIIQAHNGKVWVESEEGNGSIFYFSVPLAPLS